MSIKSVKHVFTDTADDFHGFYIRWLLISLCAHMEEIRHFDLLKAVGYIERVIKSDFFSGKRATI